MHSYGGLLESRWSNLTPLKYTFTADVQVVLVYLERFRRNSVLKCVLQPKIAKNSLNPIFSGSRSFKVIDVGTTGKLVSSACHDKQTFVSICNRFHAR